MQIERNGGSEGEARSRWTQGEKRERLRKGKRKHDEYLTFHSRRVKVNGEKSDRVLLILVGA